MLTIYNMIYIMPYNMKKLLNNDINLETKTLDKLDNNYFANYVGRRHHLDDVKKKSILQIISNSNTDKTTLKNAYEAFKKECRSRKESVLKYSGDSFLNLWNQLIYQEYKKTDRAVKFPNAYPRV